MSSDPRKRKAKAKRRDPQAESVSLVADSRLIVPQMTADEVKSFRVQQQKAADEFLQLPEVRSQLCEVERCTTAGEQRQKFIELQPKLCRDFRRWRRERGFVRQKECWPSGLRPSNLFYETIHPLAEGTFRLGLHPDPRIGITLPGSNLEGEIWSRKELSQDDDDAYCPIADLSELQTWLKQFEIELKMPNLKSPRPGIAIDHGYRWLSWLTGRRQMESKDDKSQDVVTRHDRLELAIQAAAFVAANTPSCEQQPTKVDGPLKPDGSRLSGKKQRRRRRSTQQPKKLTPKQTEALKLHGDCNGNIAEVARRIGKDRKTAEQHVNAAFTKLGQNVPTKAKTTSLKTDRRGQADIAKSDDHRG